MSQNVKLVPGENYVIYIYDGGAWKPYICARSGSMTVSTDFIDTSVTGSGSWRTVEPTVKSFTGTLDGVISAAVTGYLSLAELQALQFSDTVLLCRFTQTAVDGTIYTKECYFYIAESTDTGSFDGVATFQIQLQGTGSITQVFTPPSPTSGKVYRYPAAGSTAPVAAGTLTVSIPTLALKDILEVVKDGVGNNDIILSGTPIGKEVLYDSATGDFTWANAFDGETFYILYQNL